MDQRRAPTAKDESAVDPLKCADCPIRGQTCCSAVDMPGLPMLDSASRLIDFTAGETVFYESDPGDFFFNIIDGAVKLYKLLPDGRRQITGFLLNGDFIGFGSRDGYACAAEVLTDTRLCRIRRTDFMSVMEKYPGIQSRLLFFAADRINIAYDRMLLLGRKTAAERMASFLDQFADRSESAGLDRDPIQLPMPRNDIADYLGLTPETVSRTLTKLVSQRIITIDRPEQISVIDADALKKMAGSN